MACCSIPQNEWTFFSWTWSTGNPSATEEKKRTVAIPEREQVLQWQRLQRQLTCFRGFILHWYVQTTQDFSTLCCAAFLNAEPLVSHINNYRQLIFYILLLIDVYFHFLTITPRCNKFKNRYLPRGSEHILFVFFKGMTGCKASTLFLSFLAASPHRQSATEVRGKQPSECGNWRARPPWYKTR